eukprot:3333590-Pleurochrysis_carterae.AAC.1
MKVTDQSHAMNCALFSTYRYTYLEWPARRLPTGTTKLGVQQCTDSSQLTECRAISSAVAG